MSIAPQMMLDAYISATKEAQFYSEANKKRKELENLLRKDFLDRFSDSQLKDFQYYSNQKYFPYSPTD